MKHLMGIGLLWLLFYKNAEAVQRFDDDISIALVEKGRKQLNVSIAVGISIS